MNEPSEESNRPEAPSFGQQVGIVFHQDSAKPHTSIVIRQKCEELGLEVVMHTSYSPVFAPSNNHLFLFMTSDLAVEELASKDAYENRLSQFLFCK